MTVVHLPRALPFGASRICMARTAREVAKRDVDARRPRDSRVA
jgi:hypothetical protein